MDHTSIVHFLFEKQHCNFRTIVKVTLSPVANGSIDDDALLEEVEIYIMKWKKAKTFSQALHS